MTPANKEAILYGTGSLLMSVGVFAKPLDIPEPWQAVPLVAGGVMYILVIRLQKMRKAERERTGQPAPVAPLAARKKLFWIVALSLIVGSVGVLPLLPYTVDNFQPWIYYWVIPAQIVFLAFFLTFLWRKWTRPEATNIPDNAGSQQLDRRS